MHTTNGVSAASVCAAAVGAGDDESTGCGVMDVAEPEATEPEVAVTDGAVTEVAELACLPESEHAAAISKHDVTIARRFISQ